MSKKYAILLVRVSTLVQDYEPQIDDLKKYALLKGYNTLQIIETKESGLVDLDKKVGTNKLFSFIQENPQYNVVFATEISRLGRRQSVLHQIKEWFVKHKIQLFVKDIGYSLLDDNGKVSMGGDMMFSMYGLFAETEIQQKKDRFIRARKSLMEMGYSISGKTLFGYERIRTEGGKTTLIPHIENSNVVRTIFNWYNNGINVYEKKVSIKRIVLECRKLGFHSYTHSKRNVNKLLKEEGYVGVKITNNKRKNYNYQEGDESSEEYKITSNKIVYPIIIDKETFDLTQKRLKENNSRVEKSHKNITILSQLIKCNSCEGHYTGGYRKIDNRILNTYRCCSRVKPIPCKNKQSISMIMIDSVVWGVIKTDLDVLSRVITRVNPDKELELLKKSLKGLEDRSNKIDEEIKALNQSFKSFSKLKNVTSGDFINTIKSKVTKLDKEKGLIENEISRIKVNLSVKNEDLKDNQSIIQNNLETIEESKELLKKYINLFVERIDIIFHNTNFSVIRVKFKIDSHSLLKRQSKSIIYPVEDGEIELYTNIILDKRHAKNVKSYKSTYSIREPRGERFVTLIDTKTPRTNKRIKIDLEDIENPKYKKYIKPFHYSKLNVY